MTFKLRLGEAQRKLHDSYKKKAFESGVFSTEAHMEIIYSSLFQLNSFFSTIHSFQRLREWTLKEKMHLISTGV